MGDFKGSSTNVTTINATLVTADDLEVDSTSNLDETSLGAAIINGLYANETANYTVCAVGSIVLLSTSSPTPSPTPESEIISSFWKRHYTYILVIIIILLIVVCISAVCISRFRKKKAVDFNTIILSSTNGRSTNPIIMHEQPTPKPATNGRIFTLDDSHTRIQSPSNRVYADISKYQERQSVLV